MAIKIDDSKVCLVIFRPQGQADLLVFKKDSEALDEFIQGLNEEGRGYVITEQVMECLGQSRPPNTRPKLV